MRRDYRVIVIGLGGIGLGATYWLGRRLGGDVLGLEQYELGHDHGASHDHSRIIRLSYHRPAYVRLARRAYETWSILEAEAGERIVLRTGGLDVAPRDAAIPLSGYMDSMTACGVAFEHLDASEITRRWPQWRLTDDCHGLFQENGGLVDPMRANAAHARLGREYGVTLCENARVTGLRMIADGEIGVTTADATYRAASVVIATDAWTNGLLAHLGRQLPLTVTREQVSYFAARRPEAFEPEVFPVWIWMDVPSFYGFPTYGEKGPKVGEDVGGIETTAETRSYATDAAGLRRVRDFLAAHLPDAVGPEIVTRTCLYTLTPDRDFVIDTLPQHRGIHVLLGAAHGFKHASLFGRIVAERIIDGSTPSEPDLTDFRIDRSVLQLADPPTSFMV
jgi:sarcosine oxidase